VVGGSGTIIISNCFTHQAAISSSASAAGIINLTPRHAELGPLIFCGKRGGYLVDLS
jgi:hypothetical protein